MELSQKILSQLEEKGSSLPCRLEIKEGRLEVEAELLDLDRLGCLVRSVTLRNRLAKDLPLAMANRVLEGVASSIIENIHYLQEDLAIIEWDQGSATMIMRSSPPGQQGEKISYYEIVLSQGWYLKLTRLCYDRSKASRTEQPMTFTREVFVRLIEDLSRPFITHQLEGLTG